MSLPSAATLISTSSPPDFLTYASYTVSLPSVSFAVLVIAPPSRLLVVMGALKPEETVLVHNAGGGVGLAAIDIARHLGATIYGTASSAKHAFLRQRGLHEAIDYRTKDWTVELERLSQGKGVALITDPLGGNHWKKSYKALRSTGRLGMFCLLYTSDAADE